mmetsp:Transcript_104114/g.271874  ORF Transcript_104114/g.271874 Transcript_104114/m.271874 type:complete len:201 (-) Transcript_104114:99-701(-)
MPSIQETYSLQTTTTSCSVQPGSSTRCSLVSGSSTCATMRGRRYRLATCREFPMCSSCDCTMSFSQYAFIDWMHVSSSPSCHLGLSESLFARTITPAAELSDALSRSFSCNGLPCRYVTWPRYAGWDSRTSMSRSGGLGKSSTTSCTGCSPRSGWKISYRSMLMAVNSRWPTTTRWRTQREDASYSRRCARLVCWSTFQT